MFEFRDITEPAATKKAIFIGGRAVGECKPRPGEAAHLAWHAVINLPNVASIQGLIQGFGETPEAALRDALAVGLRTRDALARDLAWLEGEVTG